MSFNKNGETRVYRKEGKKKTVGPKYANENKSNRYTVDDLVEDSDEGREVSLSTEEEDSEEEDVSN